MLPDWMQRFVVLDVETTGLDPSKDRIIELGYALFEDGRCKSTGQFFCNPEGRVVSAGVEEITGIAAAQAYSAPPFYEAFNEIAPHLFGATPVAYNAAFDKSFFQSAVAQRWPRSAFAQLPWALDPRVRWVDVLGLVPGPPFVYGSRKLGNMASQLGIFELDDPALRLEKGLHRAGVDAYVTGLLLLEVHRQFPPLDWSYEGTVERARYATYHQRRKFFFANQKELGQNKGWLDKGLVPLMYECDVCHRIEPGRLYRSGWTGPKGWATTGELSATTFALCSPACDLVRRWHGETG